MKKTLLILLMSAQAFAASAVAAAGNACADTTAVVEDLVTDTIVTITEVVSTIPTDGLDDHDGLAALRDRATPINLSSELPAPRHGWVSPYCLPYTTHSTGQNWHRMWINTAVLSGAFVGTLFVLELLPEDATAWNRASIQQTPMFKRWWRNIFYLNPEWDHDNPIFNYVLHPYAGAAYFMSARSCGFSFWGSMLYSAAISTIGWEFGIEAFMERPSYQDLFVTPVIGSLIGELCYRGKRTIVEHGYEMLGSSFLGHAAAFILDPVNEVIDLFRGNPARVEGARIRRERVSASFAITPYSLRLAINF